MSTPMMQDTGTPLAPRYPGVPDATDGSGAVVAMETSASEAAGAYPITPSTQMGEGWALAVAAGKTNVNGRRLLFFEPEGEHAAAAVTAGMSMTGLRATNFSSGQGIVYMHESLYPAVGKRLTYVLNVAARAITKHSLNVHAGHDDYHAVDDTGFFQLFAKDVQESADLNLIAHRVAELSLNPGLVAQDGFLTSHVIESVRLPEDELIKEYLGDPADLIDSPTPAQRLVFGTKRRRIPEMFDVDYPTMIGVVQNQDSYAAGVAAQRPFYFDHVADLTDLAMAEFTALTGRRYARATGYRLDDAEWVIVGQGTVVGNSEAVADYLRETRGLKVGVLNMTMFRPFPADLITKLLRGKKGVVVLERTDQPLAVDPPLLREIRAAMTKGLENGRVAFPEEEATAKRGGPLAMLGLGGSSAPKTNGSNGKGAHKPALPYAGVEPIRPEEMPDFYSGGFGFGSRDVQPGDVVAAIDNMLPDGAHRRQYYLGIEFIRRGTRLPKLQIWQEQLLEAYPDLEFLALESAGDVNLNPPDAIALRIHSVGGWGAITMGKNVATTAYELAGLNIKANPKYGSEKKGQPTTFYAMLSHKPLRVNAELKHVNVVLSPDGNVFNHSNPLAGMEHGGVFVIQSELTPAELWKALPPTAQRDVIDRQIKVYCLDGFKIAQDEASDQELRYRMQGAAFMGAFFKTSPLAEREGLTEDMLFGGIESQLRKKFGKLGDRVVQDNLRVIRRGFDEVKAVPVGDVGDEVTGALATANIPALLNVLGATTAPGNPGRFWEQVGSLYATGTEGIADPFVAISAIPAASSSFRDMTGIRFEVPSFVAEKCTGCNQCWTQCPDAAIPGLVSTPEDILEATMRTVGGRPFDRLRQITKHLGKECNKLLQSKDAKNFGEVLQTAYQTVANKLGWEADRRAVLDEDFAAVFPRIAEFPLARTAPFFDVPESKQKGAGGLVSITINPEACKGCNVCVDVCPEHALVTVKQDEEIVARLRRNWELWQNLPDTDDRYVNISNLDEGIGVLPMLLLKKDSYRSMIGGDGACMGCGEKTSIHLVVSAVESLLRPRVAKLLVHLDELIEHLDGKARALISAGADLDLAAAAQGAIGIPVDGPTRVKLQRYVQAIKALQDLKWRYTEGPGGRGRASLGITNSTGCSSVWASTYPYNPYPFPWVNHLFQDSPSVAIGVFEGHMRKMADAFVAVRRAEALADDSYDLEKLEPFFQSFDWRQFTDDEFYLCPPIMAVGGDGAMYDIGFQNVSRLLASGKPVRVLVLDTQVYSNTGGQACTSGYTGQVADMSAYGKAQHGKQEVRKEMALIAIAHRGAFVLQSSQALPSHLLGGVIKAMRSRRPAVLMIYTPCPVEHGLPDQWAPKAARMALESRAFPFMQFDPDAGASLSECLNLDGNPSLDETWPTYELTYVDDEGDSKTLELPFTTADWAATEGRFKKHFKKIKPEAYADDMLPFHEYIALAPADREGKQPFIHALGPNQKLERWSVADEMIRLSDDRLLFWAQLKEMAGLEVPAGVRERVNADMETEYEARLHALQADYEARLANLKDTYPRVIARRLAEGLVRATAGGRQSVADLLQTVKETPGLQPISAAELFGGQDGGRTDGGAPAPAAATLAAAPVAAAATAPVAAAAVAEAESDEMAMEPYIESARCTTCDECTRMNKKLFAYNDAKQAYIKDPRGGTFAQLVQAAEKCPAAIIHPGTPLNPKEKDLAKWTERAKPFN